MEKVSYLIILSSPPLVTKMIRKKQASGSRGKSRASGTVNSSKVSSSRRSGILHRSKLTAQDISADRQHVEAKYQAEMSGMFFC